MGTAAAAAAAAQHNSNSNPRATSTSSNATALPAFNLSIVSRQQELRPSQRQGALVGKWRYKKCIWHLRIYVPAAAEDDGKSGIR